jgi:hypothetical protein
MAAEAPAGDDAFEPARILGALYGPGITGLKDAFPRELVERLREDVDRLFDEARAIPGGAVPRGPERFYVEIHPERLRDFVALAAHPWLVAVSEAVLGPGWRIVEVGFDVPRPGAMDQPWHRDFPSPDATRIGRRLDSLAFNLTLVDVEPDMGPFEIAPGTQWDDGLDFDAGMFAPPRRMAALRGAGRAQAAAHGRHLGAFGARRAPRHGQPVDDVATRAGAWRRRARCLQCGAP